MERIDFTRSKILEKCDQLISLIQSDKSQLIEELDTLKVKILKSVETKKEEIERQFNRTEHIYRYDLSNNVTSNWSVSGTCYQLFATNVTTYFVLYVM